MRRVSRAEKLRALEEQRVNERAVEEDWSGGTHSRELAKVRGQSYTLAARLARGDRETWVRVAMVVFVIVVLLLILSAVGSMLIGEGMEYDD